MPKSPDKFSMDSTGDSGGMPVLSPQGNKIAFVAHSAENKLLWVRSLSSEAAQALNGTNSASHPFWSPDGRYIGFFAGGKLIKIPATGGPIAALALDMLTVVLTEDRLHSSSEWPLCSTYHGAGTQSGRCSTVDCRRIENVQMRLPAACRGLC
jgi:Tol biopolymer transport system component